jgi:PKD repeat protein
MNPQRTLLALVAALALAVALPAAASATTFTQPASQQISFGPLKVKGYTMFGSGDKFENGSQISVTLQKGAQSVTFTIVKGVSLKLPKGLASGSLKANLGSKYGKVSYTFKPTGKVKTGKLAKHCTGSKPTSRSGNVTGSLSVNFGGSVFKTVKASDLKSTVYDIPQTKCDLQTNNNSGGDTSLNGGGDVTVNIDKETSGVLESVYWTEGFAVGYSIQHAIIVHAPASAFTVASNASSAHVAASSPLTGSINYTANSYYEGGSDGKLTGDFTAKFVGASPKKPFAGAGVDGTLTVPGFVPPNQPPTAGFGYNQDPGATDVSFDDSTSSDPDGSIADYFYEFGDGTSAHGSFPTHHYASAGPYTVKLTVTDNKGATASVSHDINVAPAGP